MNLELSVLTNGQKTALHSAARQAGLSDEHRRMVQRSVGGFESAAADGWTREGFIRTMAYFEKAAGGCLRGCTPWYWRDQAGPGHADDAIKHAISAIATTGLPEPMTPEQLDRFLERMSGGKCVRVNGASRYWLSKLLDGFKALADRRQREIAAEIGRPEAVECRRATAEGEKGALQTQRAIHDRLTPDDEVPF